MLKPQLFHYSTNFCVRNSNRARGVQLTDSLIYSDSLTWSVVLTEVARMLDSAVSVRRNTLTWPIPCSDSLHGVSGIQTQVLQQTRRTLHGLRSHSITSTMLCWLKFHNLNSVEEDIYSTFQ